MVGLSQLRDQRGLLFLVLIAATAIVLWFWRDDTRFLTPDAEPRDPNSPDAFVTEGRYRTFNDQGQLASVLTSARAVHYPQDNTGHLTNPHVDLIQDDGRPWRIDASKGILELDTDLIRLQDDVRIQGVAQADQPALTMTTQALILNNQTGFITTDQPVKIEGPAGQTTAVGMEAYVDEKRMVLKSQVRSTYDPAAP